jgi:hypothetical protein
MSDTPGGKSWLDTRVEGRPVRFWVAVIVGIAVVVLGVGAWWVWGLDRGTPMDDAAMDGMDDMPTTEVRLPPVAGFYDGQEIFFVHPEASHPDVAGMLTDMMAGSPVLTVPQLADVPPQTRDDVYVFTNGVAGHGPFGFQADVFGSAPGDASYSPLRTVMLTTWRDEQQARELRSAEEVTAASDAGELDLQETGVVVNMPFLTWPEGER